MKNSITLYLSITLFFSASLFSNLQGMEIVKGSACYRFSDSESIKVAREIALSMAKREALESYEVFISSTSAVENYTLKNDIIMNLSMGILKNVKINDKSENLEQRKICRSITAEISPIEMKETIQAKVNLQRKRSMNFDSGLRETKYYKVLKIKQIKSSDGKHEEVQIIYLCKSNFMNSNKKIAKIKYYDKDGMPCYTAHRKIGCFYKDDVQDFEFYVSGPVHKHSVVKFCENYNNYEFIWVR